MSASYPTPINDSTTGGPLVPVTVQGAYAFFQPPPPDDLVLDGLFQQMVAAMTGLDPTLVRPRWQMTPPTRPPITTNWAAVGVTDTDPVPGWAYSKLNSLVVPATDTAPESYVTWLTLQTHWQMKVLTSFYGPNVGMYSVMFTDGFQVAQNREALGQAGIKLHHVGAVTKTAELVNAQWCGRADVSIYFNREIDRDYRVESLVAFPVNIANDFGPFNNTLVTLL